MVRIVYHFEVTSDSVLHMYASCTMCIVAEYTWKLTNHGIISYVKQDSSFPHSLLLCPATDTVPATQEVLSKYWNDPEANIPRTTDSFVYALDTRISFLYQVGRNSFLLTFV